MARPTTAPEALRTLRQRGSVTMGVIAMILSGGMAVLSAVSGEVSLVFIGVMLLFCGAAWTLFVRPSVVITMAGIELNNPFRRTAIPWGRLEDVAARWNLEVWADGRSYPAWAVASHIDRPQGQGLLGLSKVGERSAPDTAEAPKPSGGATVGGASRLIETGMREYAELVAEGDSSVVTGGEVTRRWEWLDVASVGVPVLLVVLGFLV